MLSQTPKKNKASATEFWRISTNHMTHHRRSALYEADIMENYYLLTFNITYLFSRATAVRQLTFVVLRDNIFEIGLYLDQLLVLLNERYSWYIHLSQRKLVFWQSSRVESSQDQLITANHLFLLDLSFSALLFSFVYLEFGLFDFDIRYLTFPDQQLT